MTENTVDYWRERAKLAEEECNRLRLILALEDALLLAIDSNLSNPNPKAAIRRIRGLIDKSGVMNNV